MSPRGASLTLRGSTSLNMGEPRPVFKPPCGYAQCLRRLSTSPSAGNRPQARRAMARLETTTRPTGAPRPQREVKRGPARPSRFRPGPGLHAGARPAKRSPDLRRHPRTRRPRVAPRTPGRSDSFSARRSRSRYRGRKTPAGPPQRGAGHLASVLRSIAQQVSQGNPQ